MPEYTTPTGTFIGSSSSDCVPILNNQETIDTLNTVLANADSINKQMPGKCSKQYIQTVEKELIHQISIGIVIGQDCGNSAFARGNNGGRPILGGRRNTAAAFARGNNGGRPILGGGGK